MEIWRFKKRMALSEKKPPLDVQFLTKFNSPRNEEHEECFFFLSYYFCDFTDVEGKKGVMIKSEGFLAMK